MCCAQLIVGLPNYKYEETVRYFFLAVGLVSRDVLPYVPTTGESKACKRMTNARKKRQDKTVPP